MRQLADRNLGCIRRALEMTRKRLEKRSGFQQAKPEIVWVSRRRSQRE